MGAQRRVGGEARLDGPGLGRVEQAEDVLRGQRSVLLLLGRPDAHDPMHSRRRRSERRSHVRMVLRGTR
jgi:hypothetical protein